MTTDIVILDGARTAIGAFGGSLAAVPPTTLGAHVAKAALERSGVEGGQIGQVFFGHVINTEPRDMYVSRVAALEAGIPESAGALNVNRLCGSGAQAIASAFQVLALGDADFALAGGVENMSRSPYALTSTRWGQKMGDAAAIDMMVGALTCPMGTGHMGVTAENVAAEAGITRDAIAVTLDWQGVPFRVFDTAGMRKKAKVQEKLEKLSVSDGLRAVKFAEVVVVLLDVQVPFESQDLRIADLAEREGRAVVVAVNKWDLEDEKSHKLNELREAFGRLLPQLRGAPMVMISALTGKGLDRLREAIIKAHAVWNTRVSTARLNRWLAIQIADHPPPAPGGRRIRLRYMTQVKTRPPTFVLFCSHPDAVPEDYKRFLVNGLRRDFDMPGTPIRLYLRAGENPYKDRKKHNVTALDKHKPRRLQG